MGTTSLRRLSGAWRLAAILVGALALAASQDVDDEAPTLCQGVTPAKVVIDQVLPYPAEGTQPFVLLRNVGGQTANLTGWRVTDSDTRTEDAALPLVLGTPPCNSAGNITIEPSRTLLLLPKSDSNPCGFPFAVNYRDEINLFDAAGGLVGSVKWDTSDAASVLYLQQDGTTYRSYPESKNVIDLLIQLGNYSTFVDALKATGLDKSLIAASDPKYGGPQLPRPKEQKEVAPQFPWWFGFGIDRSKLPPPPPPPPPPSAPPAGIPVAGPYTIMAPSDAAFDSLLRALGGGKKLPRDQFWKLPELRDILQYHIVPGRYTTASLYNNTPVFTAMGVAVTPFNDPCMTEGAMLLHDNCVDKPTPDNYTCAEQVAFEKCYFPFMTSALAAQWQGGFCQATCQRCSCSAGSGVQCAKVLVPDVVASNGIIQGISRVLFPPPTFTKAMYANLTVDSNLAAALGSAKPLAVPQGSPSGVPAPGSPEAAAAGMLGHKDAPPLPSQAPPVQKPTLAAPSNTSATAPSSTSATAPSNTSAAVQKPQLTAGRPSANTSSTQQQAADSMP